MSPSAATDFRNRIEQLGDLPTLPHMVQKLASMIGRPNVSAKEIGSLIEKDQVLAAKVLRLSTSPFYGFPIASRRFLTPLSCWDSTLSKGEPSVQLRTTS